jgi:hypothetical protein
VATDKSVSQSVFLSVAAIRGGTGRQTDKSSPVGVLSASKYPGKEDGGWLADAMMIEAASPKGKGKGLI